MPIIFSMSITYLKSCGFVYVKKKSKMKKKVYIETYGCQMNVADSELVVTILNEKDYNLTKNIEEADVILVNTCAVREHAEQRVLSRLDYFNTFKKKRPEIKIGVIGCMAERMRESIFEQKPFVEIVAGPDSYRKLPEMIETTESGQKAVNVILSKEETYEGILPTRYNSNGISAFISIMRGCDNMCTFCIVPFTRGRERSRSVDSILEETKQIISEGFKEITLIGQNVDKYNFKDVNFAKLLDLVAKEAKDLRIRFATSYPQHFTEEVVKTMAANKNICHYIHLPVQSGSNRMLELMKRGYTREWYLEKIKMIRDYIPDVAISTDIIAGFCGETEEDHKDTLKLMEEVEFDYAYMFKYSERPGTYAAKKLKDDVPEDVKLRRLNEIIALQRELSEKSNKKDAGKVFKVLVEGVSKKSPDEYFGRNSQNKVIVFPKGNTKPGDIVEVKATGYTSATLRGELI